MSPRCRIVYALYLGGYLTKVDVLEANHYREIMLYKGLQRKSYKHFISSTLHIYYSTLGTAQTQVDWKNRIETIDTLSKKLYATDVQDVQLLNRLNHSDKLTASQASFVDIFKMLDAAGVIDDETEVF